MKTTLIIMACLALSTSAIAADYEPGLQLGFTGGMGGQIQLGVADFAKNLPASLRVTAAYAAVDPGDPLAARRIFINDNTNGTPEESGSQWQFGMDFVIPVKHIGGQQVNLFLGPRYTRFTGNFEFIGGNEIFEITNREWGWGVGLESRFEMGSRAGLLISAGLEAYKAAEISGHDTTYDPDGTSVNGRDDYTFEEADDAINRPSLEPRLLIGLSWKL